MLSYNQAKKNQMKKNLYLFIFLLVITKTGFSQGILKGVIKDEKGFPIDAATVSIKDTKVFRIADAKGQFSLPAPKEFPFTIVVSSTGFQPAEAQISELKDSALIIILFTNNEM